MLKFKRFEFLQPKKNITKVIKKTTFVITFPYINLQFCLNKTFSRKVLAIINHFINFKNENTQSNFRSLCCNSFRSICFYSCSNEERTTNTDSNLTNFRITNANTFINDFYRTSWTTGTSVIATDSLKAYHITEIIVGTDTRARGYLVKDKATHELLYFADVDRNNHVFRTVNLITEEEETFLDIDRHPDYGISDGFDMIKVIDDVNNDNYQTYGDFWVGVGVIIDGVFDNFWTTQNGCGPGTTIENTETNTFQCLRICVKKKRRFWIVWSSHTYEHITNGPCTS